MSDETLRKSVRDYSAGLINWDILQAQIARAGMPITRDTFTKLSVNPPGTTYFSNNSGGKWWLTDENWCALEAAGWVVRWHRDDITVYTQPDENGRVLGALARYATRYGLSEEDAMREWEKVVALDPYSNGCDCCGRPHDFYRDSLYD